MEETYYVILQAPKKELSLDADGNVQETTLPAGTVVNTVLWDGEKAWEVPENCTIVRAADYKPGG